MELIPFIPSYKQITKLAQVPATCCCNFKKAFLVSKVVWFLVVIRLEHVRNLFGIPWVFPTGRDARFSQAVSSFCLFSTLMMAEESYSLGGLYSATKDLVYTCVDTFMPERKLPIEPVVVIKEVTSPPLDDNGGRIFIRLAGLSGAAAVMLGIYGSHGVSLAY